MSTSTTNFGLVKPALGENYSLTVLNNNMDTIDTQLKARDTDIKKLRHAEYSGGSINYPANTLWGVGVLTADAVNSVNNDFTIQGGQQDGFVLNKVGVYLVQVFLSGTSVIPQGWISIRKADNSAYMESNVGGTSSWAASVMTSMYVPIDTNIIIRVNLAAAYTATSRVRITKLQGP